MIRLVLVLVLHTTYVQLDQLDPKCVIPNVTNQLANRNLQTLSRTYGPHDYIQVITNVTEDGDKLFSFYSKECICANKVCIRKCCPLNHSYQKGRSGTCFDNRNFTTRDFNLTKELEFSKHNEPVLDPNVTESDIVYVSGDPCKAGKYILDAEQDHPKLQENGLLMLFYTQEPPHEMSLNEYCLENRIRYDTNGIMSFQRMFFTCFSEEANDIKGPVSDYHVKPLAYGMIISIPFLFITFAVYAFIPELQNLHGKSLMCYVFTLMIAYLLLSFIQLQPEQDNPACSIIAFSIFYFFLVSFFWLNVMCFDIWWTFSGVRGFRGSIRAAEHKKFLIYNLYAWGFPTAILCITLFMQFNQNIPENWITPRIGERICWFSDTKATIVYFHFPLACVVFANVFLFMGTAFKIAKIKRDTARMLKSNESKRHDDPNYNKNKQRFNLYLKLFIVMGINWVMELISVIVNGPDSPQTYTWILTDLANTLQGVLIFIIFVCKRQIWVLLVKRYHILMGRPYHAKGGLSRNQTTTYSISQSTDATTIHSGGQAVNGHPESVKLNNFK